MATVCGLLCLAVVLVFCQTGGYDFVNFDDDHYVYDNEHINRGLTLDGLVYYTYHWHAYTYHPLSTYSHMLDCQLFGLTAGWHHVVNVAIHALTAVLLFLLLRQMTCRLWPSALAAALFAIHPLRVESVAWISERKDVLSGLFFVLTLGAYVRYAGSAWTVGRYMLVCLLYGLGLLAKPMLVTLPLVLLLLDYWPLRRWQALADDSGGGLKFTLFLEKVPLLLLAVADSALTVHTQVAAIQSLETIAWPARCANALVAYVSYLRCFFWPQGLAILYPHAISGFSAGRVIAVAAILVAVSAAALLLRRRMPYLLVGWLWYLGMLVPVIGLLQVGGQSMADRYTYLPQIGLVLGLVWAVADLADFLVARTAVRRASRFCLTLGAAGIVAALAVAAWRQAAYWRDSETVWVRDLMYPNLVGHYNLGLALAKADRHPEAIEQYQAALAIDPNDQDTHNNLGLSYEALGQLDDAAHEFRWIVARIQVSVAADNQSADALQLQGNQREAQQRRRAAQEKMKESIAANKNLARILERQAKDREAQTGKPSSRSPTSTKSSK